MWREGKRKRKFHKADYRDSGRALHNPGCGWYHVYTFSVEPSELQQRLAEGCYLAEGSEEEHLALLLMDIGSFRERELSEEALAYIGSVLQFFREQCRRMILRFTYDTEGKGAEKEPQTLSLVKRHMNQLGGLMRRYAEDILVIQGIFLGSWGEMHGSRFLYQKAMVDLLNKLYEETGGSCFLAVRTPAQWRTVVASGDAAPGLKKRLALFNDGLFGSPTDLGTYGMESRQKSGELNSWTREEELLWQQDWMRGKPNGGEALLGDDPAGYQKAAEEMRQMHLSYLNSVYDPKQLKLWKEEKVKERGVWRGLSGYEYIGRHLGCRFIVCDVQLTGERQLEITVENRGFAELCEEAECFLAMEGHGGMLNFQPIGTDARTWESGKKTNVSTELPEVQEVTPCRLFLQLKRKRDRAVIHFANETADELVLLGEIR